MQTETRDLDVWVDQKEVSRITGLAERTLEQKRLNGAGPRFSRLSLRACRYRLRDVYAWLESHAVESTAQADAAGRAGH